MRLFRRQRRSWNAGPSPVAADRSDKPDMAARRAFLADHIMLQTHVPKTGGSTLSHGLAGIVGAANSVDLRLNRSVSLAEISPSDLDHLNLISGHVPFGSFGRLGRTPLYFAAVREPVARAVSGYRFLMQNKGHGQHHLVAGRDFETAWAAQEDDGGEAFYNIQSHYIGGAARGDGVVPDQLWTRVEHDYFLIIPQTEMTRTIHSLRAAFGAPWMRIADMNKSKGNETEVSPPMRDRILAANALDAELFARVTTGFEERLAKACEYIASRCLLPLKGAWNENEDRT
ncbi:MAG: hypothetical protein AB8B85_02325 [Paracoccaceae bacterium]